jgi:hypothetical protein
MNFETFFNAFNTTTDEEMGASLTPAFCPEIIALLNFQHLNAKKTFSRLIAPISQDYGFDEHAHGLS